MSAPSSPHESLPTNSPVRPIEPFSEEQTQQHRASRKPVRIVVGQKEDAPLTPSRSSLQEPDTGGLPPDTVLLNPSHLSHQETESGGLPPAAPVCRDQRWTDRTQTRLGRWVWMPEVASFLVALVAFAAIVLLLGLYKDKPQPDWPSLLGINSLVSILSAIFKVALLYPVTQGISELKWLWFARSRPMNDLDLFDAASRSPWGAANILAHRPKNLTTTVGAIVILLALAVEPFVQQVLQFYSCSQPLVDGTFATIPRTNYYSGVIRNLNYKEEVPLDPKMEAAIYQGLLNPPLNSSVSITMSCPSGNCTFPQSGNFAFSSLAYHSTVENISPQVSGHQIYNGNGTPFWNYSLPSGLTLSYPLPDFVVGTGSSKVSEDVNVAVSAAVNDTENPISFQAEVLMLNANCDDNFFWGACSLEPFAFRVTIAPGIMRYGNISYSNSFFQEHPLTFQPIGRRIGPDGFIFATMSDTPSIAGINCSGSIEKPGPNALWVTNKTLPEYNTTYPCIQGICDLKLPDDDLMYYDAGCIFYITPKSFRGIWNVLSVAFGQHDKMGRWSIKSTSTVYVYPGNGNNWLGKWWNQGKPNLDNVTSDLNGLALSITAVIRQADSRYPFTHHNNPPFTGTVIGSQTCVGVTWAWMALPALLIILAVVFCGATLAQRCHTTSEGSRMDDARQPWKSSILPLLWCAPSDEMRMRYNPVTLAEMERQARDIKICLKRQMVPEAVGGKAERCTYEAPWIFAEDSIVVDHARSTGSGEP